MKQPSLEERAEYSAHETNEPSYVVIPGTRRRLKLRELHPGTMKRLTKIWIERDLASAKMGDGAEVLKDMCKEPYFAFKEAAAMYLNHDIKLRLIYPFLWRWWAFRYTESQMLPIIVEAKKKIPLEAHYMLMAWTQDIKTDMMKMTKKEAEQYQAELLLAAKRLSSRTSPPTASPGGGSEGGR